LTKDSMLSIIVPVFNEDECIDEFYSRTVRTLSTIECNFEIIFINDGSIDRSLEILTQLRASDSRVKVISLSRNFGHQNAVTAGLAHCIGKSVVVIDCDLQDPPELIPQLYEAWIAGAAVVNAVRRNREGETYFKKITAKSFYRLFQRMVPFDIPLDSGDFRLMDRVVVDTILNLPEKNKFIRGLVAWSGFTQVSIEYERSSRFAGTTKYSLSKMLKLSIDAITSFSLTPLRIASLLGFALFFLSTLTIPVIAVLRIFGISGLGGQTTVIEFVVLFGGLNLLILGVVGEYVGHLLVEVKGRPTYLLDVDND